MTGGAVCSLQSTVHSLQLMNRKPQMLVFMYMNVKLENLVLGEAGKPGYPYT